MVELHDVRITLRGELAKRLVCSTFGRFDVSSHSVNKSNLLVLTFRTGVVSYLFHEIHPVMRNPRRVIPHLVINSSDKVEQR